MTAMTVPEIKIGAKPVPKKSKKKKEKGLELVIRVAEDQGLLPRTSPSARSIRELLTALVTLTGEVWARLGQMTKEALAIEYDPEDPKRITRASLLIPAASKKQAQQAHKLLDSDHQAAKKERKRQRRIEAGETPSEKEPSPQTKALPPYLKLNAYGLIEIRQPEDGQLPLLVFRVMEEYQYRNKKGELMRAIWSLKSKLLQAVLQNYLRFRVENFSHLPADIRQGVAQEVAQLTLSHLGLKGSGSQPYTSFAALDERHPEKYLENWVRAIDRLTQRREPFPRRKRGEEMVIDDPDVSIFRRGPYPKRMAVRWIRSDSVIIRKRKGQLYAFLPIFDDSLNIHSPLLPLRGDLLYWWREFATEFKTLPAWLGSKRADLSRADDLICLPLAHQPRLEEWLADPERSVGWTLLTERQKRQPNGTLKPEFYLHVVLKSEVKPRLRPNLLVVLPTMESGCSCLRWCLVENGEIGKSGLSVIDQIPLARPRHDRSWQKARREAAIKTARTLVWLADHLDANLGLGKIEHVDKRHNNAETNTLMSRWPYAIAIAAVADKALDRKAGAIAVVAQIREFVWKQDAGEEATPEQQVRAVAKLSWKRFQVRLKSSE